MTAAANLCVVVVDDQLSMRQLIRNGLQQLGIRQVMVAEDGEVGLRMIVKERVHLIISDFNMPKLDGVTLLRAVRAHPPTATVPFILLTGQADRDLVLRAKQHGVSNFLAKPFTPANLREKIEAVVGSRLT